MEKVILTSRKPNPTEKRLITRDWFKYYNAVIVAGIYRFSEQEHSENLSRPDFYFPALKKCIDTHPMLAAIVEDPTSRNEQYTQIQSINLDNHVNVKPKLQSTAHCTEDDQIARTIEHIHNSAELAIFNRPKGSPAWRIDVLSLEPSRNRVLICFSYSHCIGDGMSGPNFHKTFLAALNEKHEPVDANFEVTKAALPGLPHLPCSLSFLLAPALGHYLPRFIADFFGFKASVSGSDDATWLGANHFDDRLSPDRPINTATEMHIFDSETLAGVLRACRSRQTKLTALLNELIAVCMSRRLPNYYTSFGQKTNLVSCIPTNIRTVSGIPNGTIGNFAGATYSRHPIAQTQKLTVNDELWQRARTQSTEIAKSVISLKDQVVGLLGWISNMKAWMEEHLGDERDSSWQHSNLMVFDVGKDAINIERMYFCQPSDVAGQPLNFNTVSVKGGELVICAAWQIGALGLDKTQSITVEENERKLVGEIFQDLDTCLMLVGKN